MGGAPGLTIAGLEVNVLNTFVVVHAGRFCVAVVVVAAAASLKVFAACRVAPGGSAKLILASVHLAVTFGTMLAAGGLKADAGRHVVVVWSVPTVTLPPGTV